MAERSATRSELIAEKRPALVLLPPQGLAAAIVIVVIVAVVFLPVLGNGFIAMDDPQYVTKNPHVQHGLTADALRWAFTTTYADNWHPLTWISHTIDWSLYGANPRGHHLTSLVIHALDAGLLFVLLRVMTGAGVESALAALLFGLHPLRVESVAWIAERKDVLSSLFGILALLAYARDRARPSWLARALVPVCFAASLLAKPMWVTLPLLLLLLDVWPLRRDQTVFRRVAEKLPLFALAAAAAGATLWAQGSGGAVASFERVPMTARFATALVSIVKYLGDTLWPTKLALYYPHLGSPPLWQIAVAATLTIAITIGAVKLRQRAPYLLAGWLWYLVALLPVIGIVQVGWQERADRYTYLPQIGLWIAIVWGLRDLLPRPIAAATTSRSIRWGHVLAMLAVPAFAVATWRQLGYWKDSRTLAEHALAVTGDNPTVRWMLGNVAAGERKTDEAISNFREAVRIQPRFPEVHLALAKLLSERGDLDEALTHADAVLEMWPDDSSTHILRGRILSQLGRHSEALSYYAAWTRQDPRSAEAYAELGAELGRTGQPERAITALQRAVQLRPDFGEAHSNLAAALLQTGRIAEAADHLQQAIATGFTPPPSLTRQIEAATQPTIP